MNSEKVDYNDIEKDLDALEDTILKLEEEIKVLEEAKKAKAKKTQELLSEYDKLKKEANLDD